MGFFQKILEKIGLKKSEEKEEKKAGAEVKGDMKGKEAGAAKTPMSSIGAGAKAGVVPEQAGAVKSAAISEVDVVAKLEKMAAGSGLDWKVSIVDLLKILDIDSSKNARIDLAKELGCPEDLIGGDYSKMNVWLHKTVLKKIAENGGNIPPSLLD